MEANTSALRCAIMCSGTELPAWQARCVKELLAVDGVELALLIVPDIPPAAARSPLRKLKNLRRLQGRLWSYYNRRIDALAKARYPTDLSRILGEIPRLKCRVLKKGKFSEYFTESDVSAIRAYHLDFIVRFSFNIIRGDILNVSRYGVWSFHHGDIEKYRGGPPCFWEIYFDEPFTGVTLQRLNERLDGGIVLRIERFPTIQSSYLRNRDAAHFLGVSWPADLCRSLLAGQSGHLHDPPTVSSAPVLRLPSNRAMLIFFLRLLKNRWNEALRGPKYLNTTASDVESRPRSQSVIARQIQGRVK